MSDTTQRQVRPPESRDSLRADRSEERAFLAVLEDATTRLGDEGVDHVVMGGVAVATFGRPRWTHDIDLFVRPDDASQALQVLGEAGYETEETDPLWLFKAWHDEVLVDLIFRSRGSYYLDDRIMRRSREVDFKGRRVRVVPPEDLLVIKVAAHREDAPYHWFDALSLLTGEELDWDYLLDRARRSVRRVLSLLLYAESSDIAVPARVIRSLMRYELDEGLPGTSSTDASGHPDLTTVRDRIRSHPDVGKLDLEVSSEAGTVVLEGTVPGPGRRREIGQAARRLAEGGAVDNRLEIRDEDREPPVEELER